MYLPEDIQDKNPERVWYSDHVVEESRPDRYIAGAVVSETLGLRCPRCTAVFEFELDDEERGQCKTCNLHFKHWGMRLFYWDEPKDKCASDDCDNPPAEGKNAPDKLCRPCLDKYLAWSQGGESRHWDPNKSQWVHRADG